MDAIIAKLTALMQSPQQLIGIVGLLAVGAYFIYQNWGAISAYLPGRSSKSGDTAVPSRVEVISHLDAAFVYFDSIGCKEGMDLIKQAVPHAFHEHDPAPPATVTVAQPAPPAVHV